MTAPVEKKKQRGRVATLGFEDRRVTVTIKMNPRKLQQLDRLARAQRRTRSAMAAMLLEDSLDDCSEPPAVPTEDED